MLRLEPALTAPFPIWVLKNGILHRRTNTDSCSAAPSMTRGLLASARSIAATDATGSSTTCRGNDVRSGFIGRNILGQLEMHRSPALLLRDP
jgi:hypothetical protein